MVKGNLLHDDVTLEKMINEMRDKVLIWEVSS